MTRKKKESGEPEWSHFIEADKIGSTPKKLKISPGPDETKRLAKRMALVELKSLQGDLVMSRDSGRNVIFISGQVLATVVQSCVVSGKPVTSEITESFEAWFANHEEAVSFAKAKQERLVKEGQGDFPFLEESEDPEPIIEGKIDVGELVAQYLSLAINPYPHAEGEEFEAVADVVKAGEAKSEVYENPFAALKDWKHKQENGDS